MFVPASPTLCCIRKVWALKTWGYVSTPSLSLILWGCHVPYELQAIVNYFLYTDNMET